MFYSELLFKMINKSENFIVAWINNLIEHFDTINSRIVTKSLLYAILNIRHRLFTVLKSIVLLIVFFM